MKSGQLFWGFLFLTLGALLLLVKFSLISPEWNFVWDMWPIILIFWGLAVLIKNTKTKPIFAALFGVLLGIFVFGSIDNVFSLSLDDFESDENGSYSVQSFTEDFYSNAKYASLDMSTGAGLIVLNRSTNKLVKAIAKGNFADYKFNTKESDSSYSINLNLSKGNISLFSAAPKNKLEVLLNEKPIWDFNFDIGATKTKLNLKKFKVRTLDLSTGASDTEITIGEQFDDTELFIEMGAASLNIYIPKESGCQLSGDTKLIAKDLDGFRELGDGDKYVTRNYDSAENKIKIKINGAIALLNIERY